MLTRTMNDCRETECYPLKVSNTVYPDDLITDIKITLDPVEDNITCRVFVDAVHCTQSYVSVVLVQAINGDYSPLGYGTYNRVGFPIIHLFEEGTGNCIGWLQLGSGHNTIKSYVQRIEICPSCIQYNDSQYSYTVGDEEYIVPAQVDFLVSGDLDIVQDAETGKYIITNSYDPESPDYDIDSLDRIGPIVMINNKPTDGELLIALPRINDTDGNVFTVEHSIIDGFVCITFKCPDSDKSAVFKCPDSDILLDKINTGDSGVSAVESPLDVFITDYRKLSID